MCYCVFFVSVSLLSRYFCLGLCVSLSVHLCLCELVYTYFGACVGVCSESNVKAPAPIIEQQNPMSSCRVKSRL